MDSSCVIIIKSIVYCVDAHVLYMYVEGAAVAVIETHWLRCLDRPQMSPVVGIEDAWQYRSLLFVTGRLQLQLQLLSVYGIAMQITVTYTSDFIHHIIEGFRSKGDRALSRNASCRLHVLALLLCLFSCDLHDKRIVQRDGSLFPKLRNFFTRCSQ